MRWPESLVAMPDAEPEILRSPEIPRRLKFYRFQWIGIPLLMAFPLFALAGLFDPRESREVLLLDGVTVDVRYVLVALRVLGKRELSQPAGRARS